MATKKPSKKKSSDAPKATQSLAVKYRPLVPDDLVGQPHAQKIINGMIKTGKYPGAILITGKTGCGKTTIGRMIAAHMNMDKKKGTESLSFTMGDKHPDFISVNAGTNGKVDEIRKLIAGSRAAPQSNYRVILIDEAHKLTGASAEALLVPLEEPAPKTIWILCTTDPEKLLDTLSNRCTKINLNHIEPEAIVERLVHIVKTEKIKAIKTKEGKKALKEIAQLSDGSMRNAISILESLLYMVEGGADFSVEGSMQAYLKSEVADLDESAALFVASMMDLNLKHAIMTLRKCGNARGVLNKSRWLVDFLIGRATGTAKYTPYTGRIFEKIEKKNKLKVNLFLLIEIQNMFNESELAMNSCSINEEVLLQTKAGKLILEYKQD